MNITAKDFSLGCIDISLISDGFAGLILVSSVYLIDRLPGQAYFIDRMLGISPSDTFPKTVFRNFPPSSLYLVSFIPITAGTLRPRQKHLPISLVWTFDLAAFALRVITGYWF